MDKKELRKQVRALKKQYSAAQLHDMSAEIIRHLLALPEMKESSTVLMYYSLADEVDTHEAIDLLVRSGKTVLLPVVIGDTEMEIRQYTGPKDLRIGSFNIMEPVGKLSTDYAQMDVAVVPGMSFDLKGNRLGRGKGYYDRFLPKIPNAYKIGICFPFQKFPSIPADKYDIRMDVVLS